MRAILAPFLDGERASTGKLVAWALLLFGGPLALVALLLSGQSAQTGVRRFLPSHEQALDEAMRRGHSLGLAVSGWQSIVVAQQDTNWAGAFGPRPGRPAPPPIALPARLMVTLIRPDRRAWLQVQFSPEGDEIGYRLGGSGAAQSLSEDAETAPDSALRIASSLLQQQSARWRGLQFAQQEVQSISLGPRHHGQRIVCHARAPGFSDADFEIVFEVFGTTVSRFETKTDYAPRYLQSTRGWLDSVNTLGSLARAILVLILVAYACYLYARRALEREAPHRRAAILIAAMAAFGVGLLLVEPSYPLIALQADQIDASTVRAVEWATFLTVLVEALLLGLAYSSTEGAVRERTPGKLTSLDALLTGRIFNRPVGVAVATGAAVAAWATALFIALLSAFPGFFPPDANALPFAFVNHAPIILFLNSPLGAVVRVVLGLLIPLAMLHRMRLPAWANAILLAVPAVLLVHIGVSFDFGNPDWYLMVVALGCGVYAAFALCDLLASIVSVAAISTLLAFFASERWVRAWDHSTILLLIAGTIILLPLALGAWFGRPVRDEEVRPDYARNLARRLALQAEFLAAREAQNHLLPVSLPEMDGISLAAKCLPASNVSGDFYDAVRTASGEMLFMAAEGGNDGLVSALTIALAKGFLLYESDRRRAPREIVEDLQSALRTYLMRDSGQTSVLVGTVCSRSGTVLAARSGDYPRMVVLCPDRTVCEIEAQEKVHQTGIDLFRFTLGPGEALLLYTDGLPRELKHVTGKSVAEWLRATPRHDPEGSAASLCDALIHAAAVRETSLREDDLTAFVILRPSSSTGLEVAAA
jgi:hypothetical protein